MGFRFHKSFKIAPGVRLNLSKRGLGVSIGVKGARVSIGPSGVRRTLSLPGTGISYISHKSWRASRKRSLSTTTTRPAPAEPSAEPVAVPCYLQPFTHEFKGRRWFLNGVGLTLAGFLFPPLLVIGLILMIYYGRIWLRDESNRPLWAFNHAVQRCRAGDWVGSRKWLADALPAASVHPRIAALDAVAAYVTGDYAAAKERLALLPAEVLENNSDLLRAAAYSRFYTDDAEGALLLFQRLWKQEPDNLEYLKAVGVCLMKMQDFPAAVEVFTKAPLRRRNPDPDLTEIRYIWAAATWRWETSDGPRRTFSVCMRRIPNTATWQSCWRSAAKRTDKASAPAAWSERFPPPSAP
ncbi:MAG TPA: DUF4236 domain-containing protein [Symbiobacteriaceae bacterium]